MPKLEIILFKYFKIMKKLLTFVILTYLTFTINSNAIRLNSEEKDVQDGNILKVGVLLPLSGEYKETGESLLKAIQLALFDISNKNIKIYPKDTKADALETYRAAKEFEEQGIKIVIGPIFHKNLNKLGEINNVTFVSLTNKTNNLPKNIIAFGINIDSQLNVLKKYFDKKEFSKTIFLSPKTKFTEQSKSVTKKDLLRFYRTYSYDSNPKKITSEIEKITNYRERKNDLERRIKILEKSDLFKDKNELKKLEQKHTLGKVNFDSVLVIDFGERLKSVLTSFMFSDVLSNNVDFFTINQWFDKSFFNENALEDLHFPSINLKNLKRLIKNSLKSIIKNLMKFLY